MFRPYTPYNGQFQLDFVCHTPQELLDIVLAEMNDYVKVRARKHKKTVTYYNIPAGFDIETSSWEDGENRYACQVCWQFGVNGHVCMGRTYYEFMDFYKQLCGILGLWDEERLIVYVHNLGYEFQWYRKVLGMTEVFALDSRRPAYCYSDGVEWKDSLILTGTTLEKSAENLTKYPVNKLKSWDYNKLRHHLTPLDDGEVQYAMFDVLVVMAIIKEKMEQEDGWIVDIPMTRTGYVRRDCRQHTLKSKRYKDVVSLLKVEPDEYLQLKRAFMGGFTHASHNYVGKVMKDVGAFDFTSSYPATMVCEKFPMGRKKTPAIKTQADLEAVLSSDCCLMDIELIGVSPKIDNEHILSFSKCTAENAKTDNGRIISADKIMTTCTDVDYFLFKKFYHIDKIKVANLKVYYTAYLPKELIERILFYYQQKTTLKGVKGKETEYALYKEMVNSIYGMMVMDIVKPEVIYDGEWEDDRPADLYDTINRYNNSRSRFLYYPWGVWVTAYSRRNLLEGILACGDNYIYSDTDSIKYIKEGSDAFLQYVEDYNKKVEQKMLAVCAHYGLDPDCWRPKTVKGVQKPLGYWDEEEPYTRFKTLGAKRYLVEYEDGSIVSTVAGSDKKSLPKYLKTLPGDPFDNFTNLLEIPKEHSGKLGAFYLNEIHTTLTDCTGITADIDAPTALALLPVSFKIDMHDFIYYVMGNFETEILT